MVTLNEIKQENGEQHNCIPLDADGINLDEELEKHAAHQEERAQLEKLASSQQKDDEDIQKSITLLNELASEEDDDPPQPANEAEPPHTEPMDAIVEEDKESEPLGTNYQILIVACYIGELMLKSGAEIFRVERTVNKICTSYGIASIQCSVTPTVITAAIENDGKAQVFMLRIKKRRWDLHRVEMLNDLSWELAKKPIPVMEVAERLKAIRAKKNYNKWFIALMSGIGTGTFALVFGGVWKDFISGFAIGVVLRLLMNFFYKNDYNDMFSRFVGGAVASLLSGMFVYIGFGSQWDLITVAALTLLFPGLLFTNALRDVSTGDFVSAVVHAAESLSIAAALAGGAALIQGLFGQLGVYIK